MANDIVARLRLNGQRFTQEAKATFSAFNRDAVSSAAQTKRAFDKNFTEIQGLARTALTMPRGAGGGLDLNVAGARQAAESARDYALALGEIERAAIRAATGGEELTRETGQLTAETRTYLQAASAARLEAEQHAVELAREAQALETLQGELDQTSTGLRRFKAANDQGAASSRAQQFALQNAGFQVQDFLVQIAGGTSAVRAFSLQGPQFIGAVAGMGAEGSKFAKIMGGSVGVALGVAIPLVGILAEKLIAGGDALDKQATKLEKAATAADSFGIAQTTLGKIVDLATGKFKTQNDVLIQSIKLQTQLGILQAKEAQKTAAKDLGDTASPGIIESTTSAFAAIGRAFSNQQLGAYTPDNQVVARLAPLKADLDEYRAAATEYAKVLSDPKSGSDAIAAASTKFNASLDKTIDKVGVSADKAGRNVIDVKRQVLALGTALNDQRANQMALAVANGGPVPDELKPYKKPKKPKSTEGLTKYGERIGEQIAKINADWTDQPKLVEKAAAATLKLDNIIADLGRRKPPGFEKLIVDAGTAKAAIQSGLDQPYKDFIRSQREAFDVQRLLVSGRTDEAEALRVVIGLEKEQGPLTAERKAAILGTVQALRAEQRQVQINQQSLEKYRNALGETRSAIHNVFTDGLAGAKALPGELEKSFSRLRGEEIFDKLFGEAFRDLQDQIDGTSVVKDAASKMADAVDTTIDPLGRLATAASSAADRLNGAKVSPGTVRSLGPAADDFIANNPDLFPGIDPAITVSGKRRNPTLTALGLTSATAETLARSLGIGKSNQEIKNLKASGAKIDPDTATQIGKFAGKGIEGAAKGAFANSLFEPLAKGLGLKTSKTGAQVGGAIGNLVPVVGPIIGSIAGSLIGGLFKKTKTGSATLGVIDGGIGVTGTSGNSASYRDSATKLGGAVGDQLQQIADALGGSATGPVGVSIGQRKKKFVVDTAGRGRTKGSGTLSFDNEEDAIRAAVENALSDGVISGISAASQRILASGQDLEKAVTKAGLIEAIPKTLKAMVDPVGAALDDLNKKWEATNAALREGGATAEQLAQASELYNLQLESVKANTASASETLKSFLTGLKAGSSSPLSLRDQETAAKAALQPFLDDIGAGKTINQEKYTSAAQTFLDIERQLYGSTDAFFAQFDKIQAATAAAIDKVDNVSSITSSSDAAAAKTAANTQASAEILAQQTDLLTDMRNLLASMAANGNEQAAAFIGTNRAFV